MQQSGVEGLTTAFRALFCGDESAGLATRCLDGLAAADDPGRKGNLLGDGLLVDPIFPGDGPFVFKALEGEALTDGLGGVVVIFLVATMVAETLGLRVAASARWGSGLIGR